jgi:hypothetical protein
MFISNAEKAQISLSLKLLQAQIQDLKAELVAIKNGKSGAILFGRESAPKRKSREWTPEQRKAASDRMKIRQANEKAKRNLA